MTKRQYPPQHYPRHHYNPIPDPDLYIPRTEHLEKLLERDRQFLEESKRLVENRMRGYPEIFLTKESYEKQHQSVVNELDRITKISATHVSRELFDPLSNRLLALEIAHGSTAKFIALSVSLTAIVVALIAGVGHTLWGGKVTP